MNVSAAIIDQRLNRLAEDLRERLVGELGVSDGPQRKSLAFVYLCAKTMLDLEDEEAFEALTDGSNDFGVDAMHIGETLDEEFVVTLFQAKYTHKNLDGMANFPEGGVDAAIGAVRYLFDPGATLVANDRLLPKVEEVRSLISDGYLPRVRVLLCNNGKEWTSLAQDRIDRLGAGKQVVWEHVNHERLLSIMQATKPVNDTLHMHGKAIVEDFDFSRVLIGKVGVSEIAALIERHGDRLLERNIRRYLGLAGNRVNEGIRDTLMTVDERPNFYFYNNGITLTCTRFDYNALQQTDHMVRIEDLQVINGGQTSHTIAKVLKEIGAADPANLDKAFVMIRLYQLASDREGFVQNITYATNSQNPVDLRDLKSNDEIQKRLEEDVRNLGFVYRRKRTESVASRPEEISSGTAAEAILSVWRRKPHQAKFFAREHFGKLYAEIFDETLTGAELVAATLLYRIAENKRKRPDADAPAFLPYAACFLAMQMGHYLARDLGLDESVFGGRLDGHRLLAELSGKHTRLDHRRFDAAKALISERGEQYFYEAQRDIGTAIEHLYGRKEQSLQRLAATFRRGDLIEVLTTLSDFDAATGQMP